MRSGYSLQPGCRGYHTIGDGTGGCARGERERTTAAERRGGGGGGGLQSRLTGHTAASFYQTDMQTDRQTDRQTTI